MQLVYTYSIQVQHLAWHGLIGVAILKYIQVALSLLTGLFGDWTMKWNYFNYFDIFIFSHHKIILLLSPAKGGGI